MTTGDIGRTNYLITDNRCTGHAAMFQYLIGLIRTDDPRKGEKGTVYNFSKKGFLPK